MEHKLILITGFYYYNNLRNVYGIWLCQPVLTHFHSNKRIILLCAILISGFYCSIQGVSEVVQPGDMYLYSDWLHHFLDTPYILQASSFISFVLGVVSELHNQINFFFHNEERKTHFLKVLGMQIFLNFEIDFDLFKSICQKSILIENWSKGIDHRKIIFFFNRLIFSCSS